MFSASVYGRKGLLRRGNSLSNGSKAEVYRVFREWQRLVTSATRGLFNVNPERGVVGRAGEKSGLLVLHPALSPSQTGPWEKWLFYF